MWPKKNHAYGISGPFPVAIIFGDMQSPGKVAAIHRLEVTSGWETLFASDFASLRSRYFEPDLSGAERFTKNIGPVTVSANATLSFNFGGLLHVEHRPFSSIL